MNFPQPAYFKIFFTFGHRGFYVVKDSSTLRLIGRMLPFAYYAAAGVLDVLKTAPLHPHTFSLFSMHEIPRIACCPVIRTADSPPFARFPGSCFAIFLTGLLD